MRRMTYLPPCVEQAEFTVSKGFAVSDGDNEGTYFEDWEKGEEF